MADPAKNQVAIEDVLSSIRRLVAEDHTDGRTGTSGSDTDEAESPKLVLTSAHRVAEQSTSPAPEEAAVSPVPVDDLEAEDLSDRDQTPDLLESGKAGTTQAARAARSWAPDDRLSDWDPSALPEDGDAPETEGLSARGSTRAASPDAHGSAIAFQGLGEDSLEETDQQPFAHLTDEIEGTENGVSLEDIEDLSALDGVPSAGPFEAETGDVDWPDAGANKALHALARVRSKGASDALGLSGEEATPATESGIAAEPEDETDAGAERKTALLDPIGSAAPETEADQPDLAAFEPESANLADPEIDPASRNAPTAGGGPEADLGMDDAFKPVFSRRARGEAALDRPEANPSHDENPTDGIVTRAHPTESQDEQPTDTEAPIAKTVTVGVGAMDATNSDAPQFDPEDVASDPSEGTDAESAEVDPIDDLGQTSRPFPDKGLGAEDGFLDEDTLREIVAEVVREELRGVLGQRITRNVRKMVRREIRLVLAADDLD